MFFSSLNSRPPSRFNYQKGVHTILSIKISTIVTWAIFMTILFILTEKMALIMGGNYHIAPGKSPFHYEPPQNISQYIPFFGQGLGKLGYINHTPYWIMVGIILLSILCFVALLYPMYKSECGPVNHWHAWVLMVVYSSLLITGIVLTPLFFTDSQSNDTLRYFSLILTLLEIPFFITSIRYYFNNRKMVTLALAGEDHVDKVTWKNFADKIFVNAPRNNASTEQREKVFFDYQFYAKAQIAERRQYLRTKKRQAIFHSFNPWIVVMIICIPTIAQQVVFASYAIVDKLMVVNFAPHAYSGSHVVIVDHLNIATQYNSTIQATIYGFVAMLSAPAGLLFSYAFGRRNKGEAYHVIGNTFIISLLCAVGVVFVGYFLLKPLINFQAGFSNHADNVAKTMAFNFSEIFLFGFPLALFSFVLTSLMIAEGRAVSVFMITLTSALLNILFNWILLTQTSLGIRASAIANVLIYFCTSALAITVLAWDRSSWIRLRMQHIRWDPVLIRRFLSFGSINFVNAAAGGFPIMILIHLGATSPVNAFNVGGTMSSPTNGVVQAYAANSPWYSMMRAVAIGLVIGGRNITAYCYSGKLYYRMRRFFWIISIIMSCWMLFAFLILVVFGKDLIGFLIKDPKLSIDRYYKYLLIAASGIALWFVVYIAVMFFQVTGKVYRALVLTSMLSWFVQVPVYAMGWAVSWGSDFTMHYTGLIFFVASFVRSIIVVSIAIGFLWFYYRKSPDIFYAKNFKSVTDDEINQFDVLIKKHRGNINTLVKNTDWIPNYLKSNPVAGESVV